MFKNKIIKIFTYIHFIFGIGFIVSYYGRIEQLFGIYKDCGIELPVATTTLLRIGDFRFSAIVLFLSFLPIIFCKLTTLKEHFAVLIATIIMFSFMVLSVIALEAPLWKLIENKF
ncbi:hypothetical protein [Candidatus Uabimicrobium sp. HlEnr_7]|uniref:hypothetical protein n=1 Tax=Candidatus Uabimicrobium helgolandensis TaxID=3095367 RepID=UPI0035588C09